MMKARKEHTFTEKKSVKTIIKEIKSQNPKSIKRLRAVYIDHKGRRIVGSIGAILT